MNYTDNGFNLTNVQESGTFTQTLTAENGCDSVIVLNLTVNSSLAETNQANELSIRLFPNPTEDLVTIELNKLDTDCEITLFDMQGKVLIRQSLTPKSKSAQLNLTQLASGIYSLHIITPHSTTTHKVIKR